MVLFPCFYSIVVTHRNRNFFQCFSIVSRVLYAIMVPHRNLNFSIAFPSHQFPSFYSYFTWYHCSPTSEPQFFHCFSIVLLHFFIIVPRSIAFPSLMVSHRSPQFFPLLFHSFTVLLDIIFPSIPVSPVFFHNFSSNFTQSSHSFTRCLYQFNLSFHFINFQCFAMVLLDFSIITLMLPQCV